MTCSILKSYINVNLLNSYIFYVWHYTWNFNLGFGDRIYILAYIIDSPSNWITGLNLILLLNYNPRIRHAKLEGFFNEKIFKRSTLFKSFHKKNPNYLFTRLNLKWNFIAPNSHPIRSADRRTIVVKIQQNVTEEHFID